MKSLNYIRSYIIELTKKKILTDGSVAEGSTGVSKTHGSGLPAEITAINECIYINTSQNKKLIILLTVEQQFKY